MLVHKLDARIQISQHVQEVIISSKSAGTGSVKAARERLEIRIILQVGSNLISKIPKLLLFR